MSSLYYTVKEIKEKEHCGRDRAYDIAKKLPHELRGKDIYVFAEDYDNYYKQKRQMAIEKAELNKTNSNVKVYSIKKLG